MKKLILFGCLLAIVASGCSSGSSGGGVPVDNSRLSGDWSYVLMAGGSFITISGYANFYGDGTAIHTETVILAVQCNLPINPSTIRHILTTE